MDDASAHDALVHDALVHKALVHKALVHDALVHDALVHKALVRDALVHDALPHEAVALDVTATTSMSNHSALRASCTPRRATGIGSGRREGRRSGAAALLRSIRSIAIERALTLMVS